MNAEQRKDAGTYARLLEDWYARDSRAHQLPSPEAAGIAALLRAGIAASEECERWKSAMGFAAIDAVSLKHQRDEAWLAAWDAEWRAQRPAWRENAKLRGLLERAAGLLRSEVFATNRAIGGEWDAHVYALLAEIEGARRG